MTLDFDFDLMIENIRLNFSNRKDFKQRVLLVRMDGNGIEQTPFSVGSKGRLLVSSRLCDEVSSARISPRNSRHWAMGLFYLFSFLHTTMCDVVGPTRAHLKAMQLRCLSPPQSLLDSKYIAADLWHCHSPTLHNADAGPWHDLWPRLCRSPASVRPSGHT